MDAIQSIILGITQGITEFLPISSSGHLVLVPYLFNWTYNGLGFDVSLHFGTVLAIVGYFWKDWTTLIASAIRNFQFSIFNFQSNPNEKIRNDKLMENEKWKMRNCAYPSNLLWQILIASIPAAIVGYLISDYVESTFHSPVLLAINLAVFGVILYLVDRFAKRNVQISKIKLSQSFTVGLAQCLALVPGVSRSGITMLAGRTIGLNRESAARFSFLLGTPAMIGAFLFQAKDMTRGDLNLPFFLGVASSAIFGFLAIKYLLQYLKKGSFSVFMWYRIVLALIVIAVYLVR